MSRVGLKKTATPKASRFSSTVLQNLLKIDRMRGGDETRTEPYTKYGEGASKSATKQAAIFRRF